MYFSCGFLFCVWCYRILGMCFLTVWWFTFFPVWADVTRVLCELELIIKKVKVSTTPDGKVMDLFFITDTRLCILSIYFVLIICWVICYSLPLEFNLTQLLWVTANQVRNYSRNVEALVLSFTWLKHFNDLCLQTSTEPSYVDGHSPLSKQFPGKSQLCCNLV